MTHRDSPVAVVLAVSVSIMQRSSRGVLRPRMWGRRAALDSGSTLPNCLLSRATTAKILRHPTIAARQNGFEIEIQIAWRPLSLPNPIADPAFRQRSLCLTFASSPPGLRFAFAVAFPVASPATQRQIPQRKSQPQPRTQPEPCCQKHQGMAQLHCLLEKIQN